jgi:hypothetical protein
MYKDSSTDCSTGGQSRVDRRIALVSVTTAAATLAMATGESTV